MCVRVFAYAAAAQRAGTYKREFRMGQQREEVNQGGGGVEFERGIPRFSPSLSSLPGSNRTDGKECEGEGMDDDDGGRGGEDA